VNDPTPLEELRDALVRAQGTIDRGRAAEIAARIASDEEVMAVARSWVSSGEWPSQPELEGWTPADLARLHRPSFVLTALLWLREDPEQARKALRHTVADPEVPYTPDVTTDPVAAGFFTRREARDS
jgi:hypothetical protein